MNVMSFALLAALFALATPSARADELMFEPAVVAVSGRVMGDYVVLGSGEMLKGNVLWLSAPTTVKGNPDSASGASRRDRDNVRKILLESPAGEDLSNLAGEAVTLRGSLFNEPSDEHHTDVLMKVVDVIEDGE